MPPVQLHVSITLVIPSISARQLAEANELIRSMAHHPKLQAFDTAALFWVSCSAVLLRDAERGSFEKPVCAQSAARWAANDGVRYNTRPLRVLIRTSAGSQPHL
jgi:hypothetical protein